MLWELSLKVDHDIDQQHRSELLSYLQDFKRVAVHYGTWDTSVTPAAAAAEPAVDTPADAPVAE